MLYLCLFCDARVNRSQRLLPGLDTVGPVCPKHGPMFTLQEVRRLDWLRWMGERGRLESATRKGGT